MRLATIWAMSDHGRAAALTLMEEAGVAAPAIAVFLDAYDRVAAGETGLVPEADLEPVTELPHADDLVADPEREQHALAATAVLKLNGGLGTSMGLAAAKSLLPVRDGLSFLDLIARQVLALREQYGVELPLLFMNSFRTEADTREALAQHPGLATEGLRGDLRQNSEPKLLVEDLSPVSWPADPELEWCPPGHGDVFPALLTSGLLRELLDRGIRTLFVSNADNLGAVPDPAIAAWFAASGASYAAEFCRRTPADRKGGHLARRRTDGRWVLRESAQTDPADADHFADIEKHRYFNTNNLWLDVAAMADRLERTNGVLGLPIIRNLKTVDPTDAGSPKVVQLETAMGSAIAVFEDAQAIEVPRGRFLPVKTTDDLLLLRSDVYDLTAAGTLEPAGPVPLVQLSSAYKFVDDFDRRFPAGPPSLRRASRLTVHGDWTFGRDVAVAGRVELDEPGGTVPDGTTLTSTVPGELS